MIITIVKPVLAQMFCFANQLACVSRCAVALLLIKETVFLLSENRQASERQEETDESTCPRVTCQEPEVADLDCEFPFLCVALALAESVVSV